MLAAPVVPVWCAIQLDVLEVLFSQFPGFRIILEAVPERGFQLIFFSVIQRHGLDNELLIGFVSLLATGPGFDRQ